MPVTVNVNMMSLCHKGSTGIAIATVPDVCKTPAPPAPPVPIPYPNIAMSSDLAKGTTKVKADGQSVAISPSEFSMSTGDEPGSVGGIVSSTFKGKATWISFSFNVFAEGKPVCRLMDKMLMNKGNTVCLAGLLQQPLTPDMLMVALCEIACECKTAALKQNCMSKKIRNENYDKKKEYPKSDAQVWTEVSMKKNGKWGVMQNKAGTAPTANPYTPGGGIRPDLVTLDTAGNKKAMIEVKFPGDSLNANQSPGGKYHDAARDLGLDYLVLEVDKCPCWAGAGKKKKKTTAASKQNAVASPAKQAQAAKAFTKQN